MYWRAWSDDVEIVPTGQPMLRKVADSQ